MLNILCIHPAMGVWGIFPGEALGDFSKIFLEGAKTGEICFFPLKTKKTTFFCWEFKNPFRRPPSDTHASSFCKIFQINLTEMR